MHCYRLCARKFRGLDGEGARLYGGRWNRPGRRAVYASSSRALAVLEMLVHVDRKSWPSDLVLLTIALPSSDPIARILPASLSADWVVFPPREGSQAKGDAWLESAAGPVLAVPSVLIPEEWNYLLNPGVAEFTEVVVVDERPFRLDGRLHC